MSEVIIYHAYSLENEAGLREVHPAYAIHASSILIKIAKALALVGILFLLISYAPSVWFWVSSAGTRSTSKILAETAQHSIGSTLDEVSSRNIDYQPRLDETLPMESKLKIISIGVDTTLAEATYDNYEEALKKGVWRVSDFGTPADRQKPTILAAHRFGYLMWSNQFRRENSFYNLPKLLIGSIVEIDWKQRKYLYEVYSESKGDAITDYSADLILYTCEDLTSPIRIFKYAKLLTI